MDQLQRFKKSIASNNRQAIQKYLLQIKNITQEFLNNALFHCIDNYKVQQQSDQCFFLLLRYVSQNGKIKPNLNCQKNELTLLMAACKKGQYSLVKRLLENGAKPDFTNSKNIHPLQIILQSRQQNYDIAEFLINQMQTINFVMKNSYPILIAIQKEFFRIFKTILDKGAQLIFDGENILHFIMKKKFKSIKAKKKFLKELCGKNVVLLSQKKDKNEKQPLQYEENEEIRTFYIQNFKNKQKNIEQQASIIQKVSNNSSILFLNQRLVKKDNKTNTIVQKRKNKDEIININVNNNSTISVKKQKQGLKIQVKESKEQDCSFQQEIDQKSQNQDFCEEQENSPKFIQKNIVNLNVTNKSILTVNPTNSKKITKLNTSFTNSSSNNVSNLNQNSNPTNKIKSKYRDIPSKTQSNLRNTNKKTNYQQKKTNTPIFNPNSQNNSSKINSKINKIINSFHQQVQQSKKQQKQISSPLKKDQKLSPKLQIIQTKIQKNFIDEDKKQIIYEKLQKNKIQQISIFSKDILQNFKLPEKSYIDQIKSQKIQKSISQKILQECQKILSEIDIKDDQQATDLTALKKKFNQVIPKYQNFIESQAKPTQQKLKQLKIINNSSLNSQLKINSSKDLISNLNNQSSQFQFLTKQICQIQKQIDKDSQKLYPLIQQAIKLINTKVKMSLQASRSQKIDVNIQMYGSRANGLQIQSSDIDLLIVCNIHNAGVHELMNELQKSRVFQSKQIVETKFLTNTSMPIVKLCLNKEFQFLNIDLTFNIRGHTGVRCTDLIKQFIISQPLLKPLVISLKSLLSHYHICDTYKGGLGSYSLTLMAIALLQFTQIKKTQQNLGQIFLQFLLFYGFQLDYVCQAIIIYPPGFNEKLAFSIYSLPYSLDLTPKLIIYDPLNPVNNVGRATYRIVQLKKLFKIWYVKLRTQFWRNKNGIQRLKSISRQLLDFTKPTD